MPSVIKSHRVIMREAETPAEDTVREARENSQDPPSQIDPLETEKTCAHLLSSAREEAARLLEESRQEAGALIRQAETDAGVLRDQAEKDAYKQGLDKAGHEMEQLFTRAQGEIDEIIREAHKQRDAMMDNLEPRIFKLALEVAEKILGYEMDHNEDAYLSMLRQAMSHVKSENRVILRVNPSEYVRYFKSREVTMHTANGSIKAEVVNDPAVGYGGCLIETESGAIDAGVDAQLTQIGRNLGLEDE